MALRLTEGERQWWRGGEAGEGAGLRGGRVSAHRYSKQIKSDFILSTERELASGLSVS